ncbi:MAG: cupin domain-containing protein [Crocinitomicaceae bacterium]
MNLTSLHQNEKPVSANLLFKSENAGTAISIQILKSERLAEHSTKTSAVAVCVSGKAIFENENGEKHELSNGDYVLIEPHVKHWIDAIETTQILLVK